MILPPRYLRGGTKVTVAMGDLSTWIALAGIPVAIITISSLLRLSYSAPQTAASDIFAALVLFDGAVVLNSNHFAPLVAPSIRNDLIMVMFFSTIVCVAAWIICIVQIERRLLRCHVDGSVDRPVVLFGGWLLAWIFCLALVATHLALFTGRIML